MITSMLTLETLPSNSEKNRRVKEELVLVPVPVLELAVLLDKAELLLVRDRAPRELLQVLVLELELLLPQKRGLKEQMRREKPITKLSMLVPK